MAACGSRCWARNWADLECTKMHWRQSGAPEADASVAEASQAINSVLSILGVSKRADGRFDEVWSWGDVISFRISEAVRCADRSTNTGRWPVFSEGGRWTYDRRLTTDNGGRQTVDGPLADARSHADDGRTADGPLADARSHADDRRTVAGGPSSVVSRLSSAIRLITNNG
jgi:hypothetical protein